MQKGQNPYNPLFVSIKIHTKFYRDDIYYLIQLNQYKEITDIHSQSLGRFFSDESINLGVETNGTLGLWKSEIEKEDNLDKPIEWKVGHYGISKEIQECKGSKDTPVDEPLNYIILINIVIFISDNLD